MITYKFNELYISIVFIGMLIGLFLADLLSPSPSDFLKNPGYASGFQIAGVACFIFASVYLGFSIYRKRNKQNLSAIINNTSDLIWSIDKRFRYLAFNQAYEMRYHELFGTSPKVGDLIWNPKLTIDHVLHWKELLNRALKGEKFMVDMDYCKEAGEPCYVSVSFNPILDIEQNVVGVGCFLQNITQRLLHEAEISHQNKQFKEIAFIISHTVRAPLSNILGLVEVIDKESPLNEVNERILEYIRVSAKELDSVVRNVVERTAKINKEAA
jgi:PAS domain S-box-containing protein